MRERAGEDDGRVGKISRIVRVGLARKRQEKGREEEREGVREREMKEEQRRRESRAGKRSRAVEGK